MTVIMLIMALAVIKVNQVNKTQLVNCTGQTFETGKVIRILEDNIQEDGMRVGQQSVVVKMTSGVKKGQELTTTSSAGYLFGAACKVGMRVVVLQSVAGDSVITSVYSMDRKEVIIGFVAFFRMMQSSSTVISRASFTSRSRLRLSSMGRVIRPSSSSFLITPVVFI